jgi:hypothetical protein
MSSSSDDDNNVELEAVEVQDPPAEKKKKKKAGFADEDEVIGTSEGLADDMTSGEMQTRETAIKKASGKRGRTTLAKMRQTLVEGAQEVSGAVADASSNTIAMGIEAIVVAADKLMEDEEEWGAPDDLTLSEAYMLLWCDEKGNIAGKESSAMLQAVAYGAMLIDLLKAKKISIQKLNKKLAGAKWDRFVLHPAGTEGLENFLDDAFTDIADDHEKGKRQTVAKFIESVCYGSGDLIESILDSLVDKEIYEEKIEKKCMIFSKTRFETLNNGPKEGLVKTIREILLDKAEPSLFFTVLLRCIRKADSDSMFDAPFMKRILTTKLEMKRAGPELKNYDKLPGEER